MVSSRNEAKLRTGVLFRQMAGLLVGHLAVVDAVQNQQRSVGETLHSVNRPVLLQLAVPCAGRAREVLRPDDPDIAAVLQKRLGMARPVVEIGPGRHRSHTTHPGITGSGQDGHRTARRGAHEPHPAAAVLEDMLDGASDVVDPAEQGEVAVGLTAASHAHCQNGPSLRFGDALGKQLIGAIRNARSLLGGESVTQDHGGPASGRA